MSRGHKTSCPSTVSRWLGQLKNPCKLQNSDVMMTYHEQLAVFNTITKPRKGGRIADHAQHEESWRKMESLGQNSGRVLLNRFKNNEQRPTTYRPSEARAPTEKSVEVSLGTLVHKKNWTLKRKLDCYEIIWLSLVRTSWKNWSRAPQETPPNGKIWQSLLTSVFHKLYLFEYWIIDLHVFVPYSDC